MRAFHLLAVFALASAVVAPACAQDWRAEITAFDAGCLAHLAEAKAKGLAEADEGASQGDLEIIHAVVDAESASVSENEILGNWRCRTIKLGGMTPDIIYSWFRCRIRDTHNGLYFEKLTGSQRFSGYLDAYGEGSYLLLGAMTVGNAPPLPYSGGNAGAGAPTTHSDAVGVLERIGESHLRLEFPYPFYESTFDVMELKR